MVRTEMISFNIISKNLSINQYRLDADYYSTNVVQALDILSKCEDKGIEIKKVKDFSSGTFNPPPIKRIYTDDAKQGTPYMIPQEMSDFHWKPKKYVITNQMDDVEDWFLKEDYVVLTQSGTVGKPYYALQQDSEYVLSQNAIRIPPKTKKHAGYVYAYLASWIGQALLTKNKFGITVKHIRPTHVDEVPIPDIDDNKKEEISRLIKNAYKHKAKAEEEFKKAEYLLLESLNTSFQSGEDPNSMSISR